MNSVFKITILLILGFCFSKSYSQSNNTVNSIVLFTDRDYCLSGDSVWFKTQIPEQMKSYGNVIRIQFETASGNIISMVAKKANNGWAEGYIAVPDSLSTGQCFLFAFLNGNRKPKNNPLLGKSLFVYNRFENQVAKVNIFPFKPVYEKKKDAGIKINTNKNLYSSREEVEVNLKFDQEIDLSGAVIKASLLDPFVSEISGNINIQIQNSNPQIPEIIESDGVLISGSVKDTEGNLQQNTLVFLSITNDPPYFDYCYTGNNGEFYFFLKNAFGKAKIVLQVIPEDGKEYQLDLENNYIQTTNQKTFQSKILTLEQTEFINNITEANYIHRIFNPLLSINSDYFYMQNRFSVPFYGLPSKRVIPDEFIDLPDFQEISRELLAGLQFRIRNNEIILRMLNEKQNTYFDKEPLCLINGIPVFNNKILAELKSGDINFIDIVQNERIYGDFKINGLLAVDLYNKNNFWLDQLPGTYEFNTDLLQPDKEPKLHTIHKNDITIPDLRRTYLWQKINTEENTFHFNLSDMEGKVEITVEGLTKNNTLFKVSKIIEVK